MKLETTKDVYELLLMRYQWALSSMEARGIMVWDKKQELVKIMAKAQDIIYKPEEILAPVVEPEEKVEISDTPAPEEGEASDDTRSAHIRGKRATYS